MNTPAQREAIFGPFRDSDWTPSPEQMNNLLKRFRQTHKDICVERVTQEMDGWTARNNNAITGVPRDDVDPSVRVTCPRRPGPGPWVGAFEHGEMLDVWDEDRSCSYCGSMHPDDLMSMLRDGTCVVEPTDKSYKIYVGVAPPEGDPEGVTTESGRQVYRSAGRQGKFYFQHLSQEQRDEFIEIFNAKRMKMGYPGYFYALPFFCAAK